MKTVIEMAREAGIITNSPYLMPHDHVLQGIERFASLVAAAEREACAKWYDTTGHTLMRHEVPDAIRARSNT